MRYIEIRKPVEPGFEIIPVLDANGNPLISPDGKPISRIVLTNVTAETALEILQHFGDRALLTEVRECGTCMQTFKKRRK